MFGLSGAERRRKKEEQLKLEKIEALTREALAGNVRCPASFGIGKGNCLLPTATYAIREHLNLQGTHLVSFTCPRGHTWWTGFDAEFDEPRKPEPVNSADVGW